MSKITIIFLKGCALAFLLILFCIDVSMASPPPLRDEVLLNGTWSFTPSGGTPTSITVPGYWNDSGFTGTKQATYTRNVTVPSTWAGKIIKLEFEGVLHVADVYVNGQFAGSHVGGYIPFSFDVTNKVTTGSTFTLRVDVKIDTPPFLDADGHPLWPIGFDRDRVVGGIIFDVWLRAYGKVHIVDSFIQTSYRNKTLKVDYTLKNSDSISHTVLVKGNIINGVSFNSPSVTLAPGKQKAVQVVVSWPNPSLWTPATPNLYTLNSKVMEGAAKVDEENKRFGFREIWIEGNQFMLNGNRVNLWGDNDYLFAARRGPITVANLPRKTAMENPATYSTLMHRLLNFNIRVLRLHGSPAPDGVLDMADEKGMIIIEESAVTAHGAKFSETPKNKATFISNLKTIWIRDWVKARRNHPSIFIWSVDSESGCNPPFGYGSGFFTGPEQKSLGDTVRLYDPTRPVDHDGSGDVPDDVLVNYHYPEGWDSFPTSPYQFTSLLYANKPTGVGEYLSKSNKPDTDKQNARWWHGLMARGLRYNNFTDIRPWTRDWYLDEPDSERALYFKNSFAPIALFDKDYDGLGIAPLKDGLYPSLDEGANVTRTLILYNDDFRDTNVTVEVKVMSGSTLYASGSKSFSLALGKHIDIPCNFQVPYVGGSTIDLVLTTKKGGVQKFQETKRFKVAGKGLSGTSSNVINLGSGTDVGFYRVGKQKSKLFIMLFIMLIGYLCWMVWKRRSRQP
jgi:hypothetical protein